MRLLLSAPATNDRGPRYMEKAIAAMHQTLSDNTAVSFEYGDHGGRVGLFLKMDSAVHRMIASPLLANYPDCTLAPVTDDVPTGWRGWTVHLDLSPDLFPILRHSQFEDLANHSFADPIESLLRSVTPELNLRCRIAITAVRAKHASVVWALRAIRRLNGAFFRRHHRIAHWYAKRITKAGAWPLAWCVGVLFGRDEEHARHNVLETSSSRMHEREEDLQAASEKLSGHVFKCGIRMTVWAPPADAARAVERLRMMAGAIGAFSRSRLATFHAGSMHAQRHPAPTCLLSHEELATLFHPPTQSVQAERMQTVTFRELEPPAVFPSGTEPGAVTLGRVRFRGDDRLVGIDADARRRHMYIVGATGTGKSTLLLNLIHADMRAGRGLTVIDVHGDLADAVMSGVPTHRRNDVILFDAAAKHVPGFNPLACESPDRVDLVTSGVVSAFRKLFDSWGPRLESLLRNAVFATVEQRGTLLDVLRLLTDPLFRDRAVARMQDDVVRSFWQNEFGGWNSQYRTEAVSSVTNKIMPFLTNRQLRKITTEAKKRIDLRRIMDRQHILIANLSRGRLGQDNATLLGSLLLTSIEQAALGRADVPEAKRPDHFLYLDEFQSLVTPSTAILLSEARKYRLNLALSHQLTRQLDESTWHSVFGNVGTILAMRTGSEDAALLASAMSGFPGQLRAEDITALPNFTAYLRLLVAGQPSAPFSTSLLKPL